MVSQTENIFCMRICCCSISFLLAYWYRFRFNSKSNEWFQSYCKIISTLYTKRNKKNPEQKYELKWKMLGFDFLKSLESDTSDAFQLKRKWFWFNSCVFSIAQIKSRDNVGNMDDALEFDYCILPMSTFCKFLK